MRRLIQQVQGNRSETNGYGHWQSLALIVALQLTVRGDYTGGRSVDAAAKDCRLGSPLTSWDGTWPGRGLLAPNIPPRALDALATGLRAELLPSPTLTA